MQTLFRTLPAGRRRVRPAVFIVALLALLPVGVSAQPVAKAGFMAEGSFSLPAPGSPGGVESAVGIAWAPDGGIHVVDERRGVSVFTEAGAFVRSYGPPEIGRLVAVAVDRDGWAFLLDRDRKTVYVFDPAGELVHRGGGDGGGPGKLNTPVDLAIGPNGLVYVLDQGHKSIEIFARDGTSVHETLLPDGIGEPVAIAVGGTGHMYVSDKDQKSTLLAFPPLTEAIGFVGQPVQAGLIPVRGAELDEPAGIAVTPSGTVIVAERNDGLLWGADASGARPVGTDDRLYGGRGTGRGSFEQLRSIDMAGPDQVVALDREGRKVERVRLLLEPDREPQAVMDYPVRVQRVPLALDGAVWATSPTGRGTMWFALGGPEGRGLRIVEAELDHVNGIYGSRIGIPHAVEGGTEWTFGTAIEKVGGVALNDTLAVIAEPDENRFHVYDLRSGDPIGVFGDNYRDDRRLDEPVGVAIYGDGRVAVADRGNDRIVIFSPDLATLLAAYPMQDPDGVRVSPDDRLFAWSRQTAGQFPPTGGSFINLPVQMAVGGVGSIAFDALGNVYAAQRESSRIAIMDAGLQQLLARVGPTNEVAVGDVLTVDGEGNIFATEFEAGRSAALHWSVDVPPVESVRVSWTEDGASLQWPAAKGSFVVGYRVEGTSEDRAGETIEDAWETVAELNADTWSVEGAGSTRYRVSVLTLTGAAGDPSPEVPVLHLAAFAAFEAGDWAHADDLARSAFDAIEAGDVTAPPEVSERLAWEGLVAASERGESRRVLDWHELLGGSILQDRAFDHADRLARAHADEGEMDAAVTRAREALRVARLSRPRPDQDRLIVLQRLVYAAAVEANEWDDVASIGEDLLAAAPLEADAAFLATVARARYETGDMERASELVQVALEDFDPDPATRRGLTVLAFMAAAANGEYDRALVHADAVSDSVPASLFTDFQLTLAQVRLGTEQPEEAMAELLFLFQDTPAAGPLLREGFETTVLDVYAWLVETRGVDAPAADSTAVEAGADSVAAADSALDPDAAADSLAAGEVAPAPLVIETADDFLRALDRTIPDAASARWTEITARAEVVAQLVDTEARIGEGLQHFRDANARAAYSFFDALDPEGLSDDQRKLSAMIRAWALYSLGRVDDADEAYRDVFAVDRAFILVDFHDRVRETWELEIFTEEMLEHFRSVRPIL